MSGLSCWSRSVISFPFSVGGEIASTGPGLTECANPFSVRADVSEIAALGTETGKWREKCRVQI